MFHSRLLAALRDVGSHQVAYHSGYGSHPQGFSWRNGGDLPAAERDALADAEAMQLLLIIPALLCKEMCCAVELSPRGTAMLAAHDAEASPVDAAVGVPRAGGIQEERGDRG